MFKIVDGREHFYQWDLNRQIQVEDNTITQLHFCNRTDDCSLVVDVVGGVANVPNILLQNTWDVRVYGYTGDYTKVEKRYKVVARSKPDNYVYVETDIKNYNDLESQLNYLLEAVSFNKTAIETAQNTANRAGQTAYSTKQTLDYVVEPNLANHEERITDLEINGSGGKETLIVSAQGGVPSHDAASIYNYVRDGGSVVLDMDNIYYSLTSVAEDMATFNFIGDDCSGYQYTIFEGNIYSINLEYASAETVGDIETALDKITTLQESLIGEIIKFTISRQGNAIEYKALEDMCWDAWCISAYNTDGYYVDEDGKVRHITEDAVGYNYDTTVLGTDTIIGGYEYRGDL